MKVTRNIFIILYAILLVINDPQVARAHTIEGIGISQAGIIESKPVYVDPHEGTRFRPCRPAGQIRFPA